MSTIIPPRPMFQASVQTAQLYQLLKTATPGQVITYAEFDAVIGEPARGHSWLHTARKWARDQDHKLFATVYNIGLKCIEDHEAIGEHRRNMHSVYRKVCEDGKMLQVINYTNLTASQQQEYLVACSHSQLLVHFAKPDAPKRIAEIHGKSQATLPVDDIIKAFAS